MRPAQLLASWAAVGLTVAALAASCLLGVDYEKGPNLPPQGGAAGAGGDAGASGGEAGAGGQGGHGGAAGHSATAGSGG